MDILEIKNIIGETTEYDKKLKLEVKKPKSWCKSISAFANTLGGFLIFGISDDNQIVGLETPDKDAELISEIIKTRLNPIPEFKISFHTEDGNVLLIVRYSKEKKHLIIIQETDYLKLMFVLVMKVQKRLLSN